MVQTNIQSKTQIEWLCEIAPKYLKRNTSSIVCLKVIFKLLNHCTIIKYFFKPFQKLHTNNIQQLLYRFPKRNQSNAFSFFFFLTNFFSCVIIFSHGIKAVFALWQLNSFSAQNKCCRCTLDGVFRLRFSVDFLIVFWLPF